MSYSGRGVPDCTLAQNMETIPLHMSRLQLTLEAQSGVNRENCRLAKNLRTLSNPQLSRVANTPVYVDPISRTTGTRSSKQDGLPPKPLKSSLKTSSRNKTAEQGANRVIRTKAFESPNSSLESISERSEPGELSETSGNIGIPSIVLPGRNEDPSLTVFSQKNRDMESPKLSAQFYLNTQPSSDDEDNIPLAALTRKEPMNRPGETVNFKAKNYGQVPLGKNKERTRSVSFSAYNEFIPNEVELYSDDDTSSVHSRRRTYSYDNLRDISSDREHSHYNAPHVQSYMMPTNFSRREASPHPSLMMPVHMPGERQVRSYGHRSPKYHESQHGLQYNSTQPFATHYTTASYEQLVDTMPQVSHRYGFDSNRESRSSTPLANYPQHQNDRYIETYGDFGNSRGPGTSVYSSLSRTSSMRSASTSSLPATMYSYGAYGNQHNSGPVPHRSSRGLTEVQTRSPSMSRIPSSHHRMPSAISTDSVRSSSKPRVRSSR
ncbi:hypothetical protein K7432_001375 [Basidiobolus ranarum]|uniref:Uncharacterized protein n=1 Tax=Basidiobolus ranarum TaxID=34480 RepID=A0ABR2X343_9FUNG